VNACVKTGAMVHMLAHDLVFAADIFEVAAAIIVRANGPLVRGVNCWPSSAPFCEHHKPTHELYDRPTDGFWRDDIGIFVVPSSQLRAL
jgi:hypothetical protein